MNWKSHFSNKKSALKKKTHRKKFPLKGIKTEQEKEDVKNRTKRIA